MKQLTFISLISIALFSCTKEVPRTPIILYGSSSVTLYDKSTLMFGSSTIAGYPPAHFTGRNVTIKGYPGKTFLGLMYLADTALRGKHYDRIIVYAGDNDVAFRTSATIVEHEIRLYNKLRSMFPAAEIVWLAIKLAPAMYSKSETINNSNQKFAAWIATQSNAKFVHFNKALVKNRITSWIWVKPATIDSTLFKPGTAIKPDWIHLRPIGYDSVTNEIINPILAW